MYLYGDGFTTANTLFQGREECALATPHGQPLTRAFSLLRYGWFPVCQVHGKECFWFIKFATILKSKLDKVHIVRRPPLDFVGTRQETQQFDAATLNDVDARGHDARTSRCGNKCVHAAHDSAAAWRDGN